MDKIKVLQGQAATLSLYNTRDKLEELVHKAEQEEIYLTVKSNIDMIKQWLKESKKQDFLMRNI